MDQLPGLVGRLDVLSKAAYQARLFRAAYAEAVDTRFYEHFAGLLAEPEAPAGKPDVALATAVSLAAARRSAREPRHQSSVRNWTQRSLPLVARRNYS